MQCYGEIISYNNVEHKEEADNSYNWMKCKNSFIFYV